MSLSYWRSTYFAFSTLVRFVVCLQTSYLHPDEFFQSFQYIYQDNVPWEFTTDHIARSSVPLYIFYYPLVTLGTWLNLSPFVIYLLVKLEFCLISWQTIEWCLYRILPIKHERVKASFFANTAYVTLVYQSHTFSNSIETCLLLYVVYVINDIRSHLENAQANYSYSVPNLILLGAAIALGLFNRITFVAWLLAPSYFLVKYLFKEPARAIVPIASFALSAYIFVLIDTYNFNAPEYVITPLNNLLYNTDSANLAKHGLHPLWTHIVVNYPQIMGPLIFLLFPFTSEYTKTTPFISYVSGIAVLSLIPHQELRFLTPLVPLACCCVSFNRSKRTISLLIKLWIAFTVAMTILMGILHQGGVVPALDYLYSIQGDRTLLFWRTYKPPTFLLKDYHSTVASTYFNRDTDDLFHIDTLSVNTTIDFMGMDTANFLNITQGLQSSSPVYLVAPLNAMLNMTPIWSTRWHYDLDHFEPELGMGTFQPGLGVYKL